MKKFEKDTSQKLIRLKEIVSPFGIINVSKSTWYNWIKLGLAPKPMKLGKRVSVWRTADIQDWIEKSQCNNANENAKDPSEYTTDQNCGGKNDVR